jgi:uncharacterized membrane protein
MLVATMALIGVLVATYLTLYKVGVIGELTCTVGSCETVNTSRWALLLRIPVAAWGVAFYLTILVVALLGTSARYAESRGVSLTLAGLTGWGVLFSAWLTWLELFVIRAICIWCVTSAAIVTVCFVASVLDLRATGAGDAAPNPETAGAA